MGEDKSETLVSVCADGRIVQWSIRKGFECTGMVNCYLHKKLCFCLIFYSDLAFHGWVSLKFYEGRSPKIDKNQVKFA